MRHPKPPTLEIDGVRQAVGALLFDPEGRLLLVHERRRREWSYPSGYVDAGEEHLEAIVREITEELGLSIAPARLAALASHDLPNRPQGPLNFTTYHTDVSADEAAAVKRQWVELTDHRWVLPGEAHELISPRFAPQLRELLALRS